MKLVLDEWIIREVIDTFYMARTTLLGITGLDSPQEVAKKSANESAITRRISKTIDIIQQSDQPEVDLEKFTEKIKTFQARYKHPESISVKGAMAFMARMFYQYPNTAKQWYDSLPKATMD